MRLTKSPSDLAERVAGEIRATLSRQQLQQQDVAEQLGWTQPYLSRRLTGRVPFGLNDLGLLAAVLGVAPADLLPTPTPVARRTPAARTKALASAG